MTREEILEAEGFAPDCESCKHYHETFNMHEYGSGFVREPVYICVCENDSECNRVKGPRNEQNFISG